VGRGTANAARCKSFIFYVIFVLNFGQLIGQSHADRD
jgi:hypothetical protein